MVPLRLDLLMWTWGGVIFIKFSFGIQIATTKECLSMFIKELVKIKLIIFLLLHILPSVTSANPVTVKAAEWTKVDNVKKCIEGTCNTFKNIEINKNTIELGQDISVTNLDSGSEIAAFTVKIIRYGRMVKMCWIGDTEGINDGTYLTVGGCKQK